MTDAEFEIQKQRLQALATRWMKPLGLNWWQIEMSYVRDAADFRAGGEPAPNTAAVTSADWRYGDALIKWNMPVIARHDDVELERMFVHELAHIFVCEMRVSENIEDHEERVATMIGKAFLWLRDSMEASHAAQTRVKQEGHLQQHPDGDAPREATKAGDSNRLQQGGKVEEEQWQKREVKAATAPPHAIFPSDQRR